MSTLLSILCITKMEPHSGRFVSELVQMADGLSAQMVLVCDGEEKVPHVPIGVRVAFTKSQGFLESVHDAAVGLCDGAYVLRIDDDERCSEAMVQWLKDREYLTHDHWKFPRVHLWGDEQMAILTPQLYPDHQTRLSVKAKAGGRNHVHAGSPFGGGQKAPVAIEHHKFLVKPYEERQAIAARYDAVHVGFGTGGMLAFNLPEDAYSQFELDRHLLPKTQIEVYA